MAEPGFDAFGDRIPVPLWRDDFPECHGGCPHWIEDGEAAACEITLERVEGVCKPAVQRMTRQIAMIDVARLTETEGPCH